MTPRGLNTSFVNGTPQGQLKRPPLRRKSRSLDPLVLSFFYVLCGGLALAVPVALGCFSSVQTENGPDHYAEKPIKFILKWLPWLQMPLNSAINFVYSGVGVVWLVKINKFKVKNLLSVEDSYMFYTFSWMAVLYGLAQLLRILFQLHELAVLDQWYTLPFFAWVPIWVCHILYGTTILRSVAMVISVSSYCAALVHIQGFEYVLAGHILVAVSAGFILYRFIPKKPLLQTFLKAALCCVGFVILKLMDLKLAKVHPVFAHVTGHFLSKVCDVLQIHFVFLYFYFAMKLDRKAKLM